MTYSELLQKREWIEKSSSIIQRDSYRCKECGSMGFRSMSAYICKTAQELDNLFDGWMFKKSPLSTFIDEETQSSSNYDECDKVHIYNGDDSVMNYYWGRIAAYPSETNFHFNTPNAFFTSINRVDKCHVAYRYFSDENSVIVNAKGTGNILFEKGVGYILNQKLTDNYVVTIEYIYPTGGSSMGDIWGSVVISITYKNYIVSFYFIPKEMKGLNVHHKYYIKGKAPWEYEDDALITLCEYCHKKAHLTRIPVFREVDRKRFFYGNATTCSRCNGTGYLPQYSHVENGVCFKCWGEGVALESLE